MATALDLQEQEQLDELKAFWKRYGNAISGLLTVVMLAFAAWNGWGWWQREQAAKASGLFEALDRAAQAADVPRVSQAMADLKDRYPRTAFAGQGGLIAAKVLYDKGQADQARANLLWVADNASDDDHRQLAHLRLAGLMLDAKQYDEALKQLDAANSPAFAALVADRRGDVLLAQGKRDDAKAAYQRALKEMDARLAYRQLIDAKLMALGAAPAPAASGVVP